jgi:hypothetical protein
MSLRAPFAGAWPVGFGIGSPSDRPLGAVSADEAVRVVMRAAVAADEIKHPAEK